MLSITKKRWIIPFVVSMAFLPAIVNLSMHALDTNLAIVSFSALLSMLLIISTEYRQSTPYAQEDKNNEDDTSFALLQNLNTMVTRLDYRDNVLIKEKQSAETANHQQSIFMASMSHELRTPMHAILNFSELGRDSCIANNYDEKTKIYFLRIEESCDRLLRLINCLINLTQLESGKATFKFEQNNIITCINSVCNEIASLSDKKSLNISLQNYDSVENLAFDKDSIFMVMVNLLSNAIKFSPKNTTINIIIEKLQQTLSNQIHSTAIKISVEDHGIGIDDNDKETIFNKFSQGKRNRVHDGGNGLGLAICKEIIHAHGGKIWAENIEGSGARISFIIPELQNGELQ